MSVLENAQIQEWLQECRAPSTLRSYATNIKKFFSWYGKSVDEFLGLEPKEMRHVALCFQNENSKKNANTVYSVLTALNSFLDYLDMPISFRGKRVRPQPDLTSHVFSNGDLTKMFEIANTKQKALLALACSLGWEVSAILELDRKTLKGLVERAKSENQQFIFFTSQRKKTGAPRFGVLNPLALEWLDKWLQESEGLKPRKRKLDKKTKDRPISDVFDISAEGANKILRTLVKHAQIKTTGRIHFHKLRGWVMSGLSRAGFNEFQIKYVMGKTIPLSDVVYLQTLESEISEKYPKIYNDYLSLKPLKVDSELRKTVEAKTTEMETMKQQITDLQKRLEEQSRYVGQLLELASKPGGLKTNKYIVRRIKEEEP